MTTLNVAGTTPGKGSGDPFVSTPSPFQASQLRYATLDNDHFTSYSTTSPAQARRALEAHLKETDRRLQDAARLGNALVEQKKTLTARLADIENVRADDEVPVSLRQKLAELEKEYNEVGRESARASLPKLRPSKSDATALSGQGASSPAKALAPSRRQRNAPNARVHDIEFATEISTSLLAQVRQLQAALAEKDEALKENASAKARLESDVTGLVTRVKQLDEHTQNFKDENWSLETKIQELEGALRDSADNEQRLNQSLKTIQQERSVAHRDLDELKLSYDRILETHANTKRQQDNDLHALRRDLANHEADKQLLQKKIDELESNNTELARAVSYRFSHIDDASTLQDELPNSDDELDTTAIDGYDMSPIKGTPARPGMLESETLKSSLAHAHRTIQNLKNAAQRDKGERLDLRRMLNEARDELERKRNDTGIAAAASKKQRNAEREGRSRRPARLGATDAITTEIFEDDPEWEDHDGDKTPSRTRHFSANMPGAFVSASATDAETSDAFETADERATATETEGFQTGAESFGEDSDELTETESNVRPRVARPSMVPGERQSYLSTASVSDDDEEKDSRNSRTPSQSVGPKYRLRVSKSARRSLRSSAIYSPASNNSTPQNFGKSLGDELAALDDDTSIEGTPSKIRDDQFNALESSPETQRTASTAATPLRASPFINAPLLHHETVASSPMQDMDQTVLVHEVAQPKPVMVDTGIMTEPWQPEQEQDAGAVLAEEPTKALRGLGERLAGVAGGALAGFGLGRIGKTPEPEAEKIDAAEPVPVAPALLSFSSIDSQEYEPMVAVESFTPLLPQRSSRRIGSISQSDADAANLPIPVATEIIHEQTSRDGPAREYVEPKVYGGGKGANGIPTLVFDDNAPDRIISSTPSRDGDLLPITKGLQIKKQMLDGGSQTIVSGQEIDAMMRDKSTVIIAELDGKSSPKRPGSSGSARQKAVVPAPPLPPDHTEKIAAAAKTPAPATAQGSMGPPLMPASAYKLKRPTTPGERSIRTMSRDGTTPRPPRNAGRDSSMSGRLSKKSSVSSFASEIEARFNIAGGHLMYPDDIAPATDPRMIQAITQTMIGEYLWKYTRKAGRVETSNSRHRRFFWVHPYTRTLYWSDQDPSTTNKGTMKAKSVPIEAVRVISDDNINPPGLHRKSIVIISRSREIVVTAPTSQRHETWFNALSYLLLRSGQEKEEDAVNDEDLEEFNPSGFSFRRSISKMTRGRSRSRVSHNTHNSRTTRNSSPVKQEGLAPESAQRSLSSTPAMGGSLASRRDSSRYSTMASRFVPPNAARGSVQVQPRAGSALSNRTDGEVYNTSIMNESAENVRQVMERQDQDGDMLENVRACCDGKHDVGSLSRTGKHMSIRSRLSNSHHHHHHHEQKPESVAGSTT